MKNRTNQRGQVLVYFGIFSLAIFALGAVAVDAGRHVFVGREAQAVADATALAGATALARGGDAVSGATSFAPQDSVDGRAATIGSGDVQVGSWSGSTFAVGGLSPNAVKTTPSFTINNIFGLWSPTSTTHREAIAAFQAAPPLPIVLCGTDPNTGGPKDWNAVSSVTIKFSTSNGGTDANTAAWAAYSNPQLTAQSQGFGPAVQGYLPPSCGGPTPSWVPTPQTVGQSIPISNGSMTNLCHGLLPPSVGGSCNIEGQTFLFPIVDAICYQPLNGSPKITGFVPIKIDTLPTDCTSGWSLTGHVVDSCATAPSATTCPSAGLVK